jgi:hypothetical protein
VTKGLQATATVVLVLLVGYVTWLMISWIPTMLTGHVSARKMMHLPVEILMSFLDIRSASVCTSIGQLL